jgi:ElaB/YqjD/DUF883 family membrane-anchored ribosome-binding protein
MTHQRAEYPLDYSKGTDQRPTPAAEAARDDVPGMIEQARQYGETAKQAVQDFKPFVEQSLKDQPMSTLAAAAAIGFVLGAIWKK